MTKLSHTVELVPLKRLIPSPENGRVYHPGDLGEHSTQSLACSILTDGIREPLIVTKDWYIVSGHRRYDAAKLAALKRVPVRRMDVRRAEYSQDDFVKLLVKQNVDQRVKTNDELLREQVALVDPDQAHEQLRRRRRLMRSQPEAARMEIRQAKKRAGISAAKTPMLEACQRVIEDLRDYWPLSIRQIHYALLNDPPPIHAAKAKLYRNDHSSYQALVKLLTQARHAGLIRYDVIGDGTRPIYTYNTHSDVKSYYYGQLKVILTDYFRDLQRGQPHHLELVAEKLTLSSIIYPVAEEFCIPLTIGRGQCSTAPLHAIAQRYIKSRKESLIVLLMSDCDPDGDAIAHSVASRLKHDFKIENVEGIKVALTISQVTELKLPPNAERAKKASANYNRYVETYGDDRVYELESVRPPVLAELLRKSIESVLDRSAFNQEVAAERLDAAHVQGVRARVMDVLKGVA
ncbi:MAG: ParB/RepB/Spo0J family partition protein [Chthoniobacterales bacterium]